MGFKSELGTDAPCEEWGLLTLCDGGSVIYAWDWGRNGRGGMKENNKGGGGKRTGQKGPI